MCIDLSMNMYICNLHVSQKYHPPESIGSVCYLAKNRSEAIQVDVLLDIDSSSGRSIKAWNASFDASTWGKLDIETYGL